MTKMEDDFTPLKAIQLHLFHAKRVVLGRNLHLQTANLIRALVKERTNLNKTIEKLQEKIDKLESPAQPRPRVPFEVEGNGNWSA